MNKKDGNLALGNITALNMTPGKIKRMWHKPAKKHDGPGAGMVSQ